MNEAHGSKVRIDAIAVRDRLRALDDRQVAELQGSIAELGLLNPIVIKAVDGDDLSGGCEWQLVAGAHRLAACKALGWHEVSVTIVTLNEHQATIAECDENLLTAKLTAAVRAKLTAHRKKAYEALHPETRHGASGNGRRKSCQDGDSTRFTQDTAERTGRSERVVQRDARRGEAIDPLVLDSVQGSSLDNGRILDDLAATPREEQPARLAALSISPSTRKVDNPQEGHAVAVMQTVRAATEAAVFVRDIMGGEAAAELADKLAGADLPAFVRALRVELEVVDGMALPVPVDGVTDT